MEEKNLYVSCVGRNGEYKTHLQTDVKIIAYICCYK